MRTHSTNEWLSHGKKYEKPMCTTCSGTELSVNHILTECLQYTEKLFSMHKKCRLFCDSSQSIQYDKNGNNILFFII